MKKLKLSGATLSAFLMLTGLSTLSCSSSSQKLEAASFQSTELAGEISVVVDANGKKVPRLTTKDGLVYTVVGKLERMIRDFYKGQTLRFSGKIESEATKGAPGVFRVEEIILEIN